MQETEGSDGCKTFGMKIKPKPFRILIKKTANNTFYLLQQYLKELLYF